MRIAVRFRYYKAVTPSMEIVDLTDQQWREFFLAEPEERRQMLARFTGNKHQNVKEVWWIPLDDQSSLAITPEAKVIKA